MAAALHLGWWSACVLLEPGQRIWFEQCHPAVHSAAFRGSNRQASRRSPACITCRSIQREQSTHIGSQRMGQQRSSVAKLERQQQQYGLFLLLDRKSTRI